MIPPVRVNSVEGPSPIQRNPEKVLMP
jgi:hypothetical protein